MCMGGAATLPIALCVCVPKLYRMSSYCPGDVVLVTISLDERSVAKTRPAVVVFATGDGGIYVSPVSSKPPTDAPALPIALDDFATGGLDLFTESYVMTSRVKMVRSGEVIGKRGHLTGDAIQEIVARVPASLLPRNTSPSRRSGSRPER